MIPAKEFDGELWIRAEDHNKSIIKVIQRERDELVIMFLEAHEGAKDTHNYWLVAANKIKERT